VPRAGAFPVPGGLVDDTEEHHISEPRINDRIRVAEVRLVGPNGEQVGIVRVEDALRLAQDADLDLVEVAPDARPPVVKIMDFGKFKYEADMKAREARRNQTNTILKEIRFRLKIDPHDYATKKGHVERFLKGGDKVKVMIMFRGREQSRPEMGVRLLQRLADDVVELGFIESMPKQDGRNMIMVLGPTKKKTEQRRAAQTQTARVPVPQDASDAVPAPDAAPIATTASAPTVATRTPARTATPAAPSPEPETAVSVDATAAAASVAPADVVAPEAAAAVVAPDAPAAVVAPDAPAAAATPAAATPTRPAPRPAPSPRPAPASRPSTATRSAATSAGGGSRSASASTGTSAPRTSSATRSATTTATTASTTSADTPAAPRPATPRPGPRATPTARAKPATPRGQAPTEGAG